MRFALLGADSNTLALARWIATSAEHQIVAIAEVGAAAGVLRGLAPDAQELFEWETLLAHAVSDAVIVAAAESESQDGRVEQLRKLIQSGLPLVVSHPVCSSMLDCHELDMIRRETRCPVVPLVFDATHPVLHKLANWCKSASQSPIGPIQQVLLDRDQADRSPSAVLTQFARDVLVLRPLLGEVQRIGALGASSESPNAYANLALQMTGESSLQARWTIEAVDDQPGAWLSLVGERGKAVLWMPDDGPWELTLPSGQEPQPIEAEWQPEQLIIENLQTAMAGGAPSPDWPAAARAVEVAEAVPRSLARGRTIELHHEVFSESGTFKGTMTSAGCGLLLAAMTTLFLGALTQTILASRRMPDAARIVSYCWIGALIAILLLFLGMQFLLPLAQKSDALEEAKNDDGEAGESSDDSPL